MMAKLYFTERYKRDLLRIYKTSLRDFGYGTAQKTMRQIRAVEARLREDELIGKTDPEHHSHRFSFVSIRNSQKLFFEKDGDVIYMVTAGHDHRNWKVLLKGLERYTDEQISKRKR
uniref:Plasmid stabilization system protein ParE n=1 Tax=Candidatus Kentrum sp. DK TaxID=2126562 RepID=A0A450TM14_9GAMM|nr:MAG: Plasmid stabilization system protein ParE [Candidatus Kentron sp. DK]